MSIIVHKDEQIDEALKRLHGEALREDIFETLTKKRYMIKQSEEKNTKCKEWRKRKRRSRRAKRKLRNKGLIS